MLYKPWRNEQKDLIKDCQTYQERYKQVEEIVKSNKEQYEYHSDVLHKAIEDLNDNNNHSAPVTPNTQHMMNKILQLKQNLLRYLSVLIQVPTNNTVSMIYFMI